LTTVLALLSIGTLALLYVRCLMSAVGGTRPRYRIADLLLLLTTFALIAAASSAWDALTILLLIPYAIVCGPLWQRFVNKWTSNNLTIATCTSAVIVGSFVALITGVSACLFVFAPKLVFAIQIVHKCLIIYFALYSSLVISFLFFWGDNYDSDTQLLLYGLPFGLPVNIVVGLLAGAALGLVAESLIGILIPPRG